MTKVDFIELMFFIKEKHEQENDLCSMLEKMAPGNYVDAFIYSEYEDKLVQVIKDALGISKEDDTIEYFLYDLEFGSKYKPGDFVVGDREVDLSSVDKLYDYLVEDK